MRPQIVIHDVNILITLFKAQLTSLPFAIEADFLTTKLIFNDLSNSQQALYNSYVEAGSLAFAQAESLAIVNPQFTANRALSIQDLSGLALAEERGGLLLTEIKSVKLAAQHVGLNTCGLLWVLDELVKLNKLTPRDAQEHIEQLLDVNCKLDQSECAAMAQHWLQTQPLHHL
ncbi:hypothetical protein BN8_p06827 (plasmid) [Fibrisoma limi BUZ 3]|uniref:PIN domain-containing protein n=1 Tax=Fibrisoma limi BUZ 3 TaxID=1185876 RepID=I2GU30_9BACT|nr:hypothetical protein [Fibrisoma limi]CCH57631.1 hypothetical protein BN8_p06827 [Fibrisoma limi BUZ 3]